MEALYKELWGKSPLIMEHFLQEIIEPEYAVPPGHMINGDEKNKETSPVPQLSQTGDLGIRIVTVASKVPVGQRIFLARHEYDQIILKLRWAEAKRFSPGGTLQSAGKLDYNISGQPGSGQ